MQQYYVSKFDGSVDGPLPIAVVRACIEAGLYTAECMIRCEGMEEWQPISILTKRGYDNPFSAIKYAVTHISFKGRATRKEYWMSHVGMMIIMGASMLLLVACHCMKHGVLSMVVVSLMLALFILFLIVHIPLEARRLHDIGYTGWLQLLQILLPIPPAGIAVAILFLFWECRNSQPGTNKYGVSDKYPM